MPRPLGGALAFWVISCWIGPGERRHLRPHTLARCVEQMAAAAAWSARTPGHPLPGGPLASARVIKKTQRAWQGAHCCRVIHCSGGPVQGRGAAPARPWPGSSRAAGRRCPCSPPANVHWLLRQLHARPAPCSGCPGSNFAVDDCYYLNGYDSAVMPVCFDSPAPCYVAARNCPWHFVSACDKEAGCPPHL